MARTRAAARAVKAEPEERAAELKLVEEVAEAELLELEPEPEPELEEPEEEEPEEELPELEEEEEEVPVLELEPAVWVAEIRGVEVWEG